MAEKTFTENCIISRPTKKKPENFQSRHFRLKENQIEYLERQNNISGESMYPLSARSCQIVDSFGEFYDSIAQLNEVLAPEVKYEDFYRIFIPVLRDGVKYGGKNYFYADVFTPEQLENIKLNGKINELEITISKIKNSMENLSKLYDIATTRMSDIISLVKRD